MASPAFEGGELQLREVVDVKSPKRGPVEDLRTKDHEPRTHEPTNQGSVMKLEGAGWCTSKVG
jgi:hypothetical protein